MNNEINPFVNSRLSEGNIKHKKTSKYFVIILIITLLVTSFSVPISSTAAAEKEVNFYGNTAANIYNDGFAAQQGDWIYYSDYSTIYKIKKDGTGKKTVLKRNQGTSIKINLNVVGEWIYYSSKYDEIGIYKVRIDGTNNTMISDADVNTFIVAGEYIYYTLNVPNTIDGQLYRIRTDGTDLFQITDDLCAYINIVEDWIYCRKIIDNESGLYKFRTDGTEEECLIRNNVGGYVNVIGNSIYYADNWSSLYKMSIENPDDIVSFGEGITNLCIVDDWIYYQPYDVNRNYASWNICRMRTDGTDKTILLDEKYAYFNVVDEWLYYNKMNTGIMGKIKIDETAETKESASVTLAAPKIKGSKTGKDLTLSWDKIDGAYGYRVYLYNNESGKYEKIFSVKNPKAIVKNVKKGTYKFKVAAVAKASSGYINSKASKTYTAKIV